MPTPTPWSDDFSDLADVSLSGPTPESDRDDRPIVRVDPRFESIAERALELQSRAPEIVATGSDEAIVELCAMIAGLATALAVQPVELR